MWNRRCARTVLDCFAEPLVYSEYATTTGCDEASATVLEGNFYQRLRHLVCFLSLIGNVLPASMSRNTAALRQRNHMPQQTRDMENEVPFAGSCRCGLVLQMNICLMQSPFIRLRSVMLNAANGRLRLIIANHSLPDDLWRLFGTGNILKSVDSRRGVVFFVLVEGGNLSDATQSTASKEPVNERRASLLFRALFGNLRDAKDEEGTRDPLSRNCMGEYL